MKLIHLKLAFLLVILSCNSGKEWAEPDPPISWDAGGDTLTVLREYSYNDHKEHKNFSMTPEIYANKLVFSSFDNSTLHEKIICIDLIDFKRIWEWNDYRFNAEGENRYNPRTWSPKKFNKTNLIFFTNKCTYSINIDNGITEELYYESNNLIHSQLSMKVEPALRLMTFSSNRLNTYRSFLCNEKLACKAIDSLPQENQYRFPVIGATSLQKESDKLFGYTPKQIYRRGAKGDGPIDTIWLEKRNFSDDTVDWTYGESRYGNGSLNITLIPPVIVDNKVLLMISSKMLCINKDNGDLLWSHDYGGAAGSYVNPRIEGGSVFFGDGLGHISCLDFETGQIKWKNINHKFLGGEVKDLLYHDGKLFAIDLVSLVVVDAETGKGIGKYASPNARHFSDAQFNAITIDEEREVMYVDDGYSILECEIPSK
jgi:outer membrane protein assembly factor BamB